VPPAQHEAPPSHAKATQAPPSHCCPKPQHALPQTRALAQHWP
jgi:hypothetical protein